MKTFSKRLLTIVLMLSILYGSIFLSTQYASAKTMSKVTKVLSLTKNKGVAYQLKIKKSEKVLVKVKILSIIGKAKLDEDGDLCFGLYEFRAYKNKKLIDGGKGSLFTSYDKLKKSSFKAGKILPSSGNDYLTGKADVGWSLPDGIKKMKVQITYYTKSGKPGIISLRKR